MNPQEPKHQFLVEVVVMSLLTVLWVTCAQASPSPKTSPETNTLYNKLFNQGTFSIVQTTNDIPESKCRYVINYPRAIDRMSLPEPKLMCKTLNTVIVDDMVDIH